MNIGIIIEYLHARGGTQRQALELANKLQDLGHKVTVFTVCFDEINCFPDLLNGLNIISVGRKIISKSNHHSKGSFLKQNIKLLLGFLGLNYLRDYCKMKRSSEDLFEILSNYLKSHHLDILNPHDYGPAAWVANKIKISHNILVLWQCNDPLYKWGNEKHILAKCARDWVIKKDIELVSNIDKITVLDTTVYRVVLSRYNKPTVVIRSGIDHSLFDNLPSKTVSRDYFNLPKDKKIILVLTLLNSDHRHVEDVIKAHGLLKNTSSWLFLVATDVGNNAYLKKVEMAYHLCPNNDRILWLRTHLKNEEELKKVYAASDIFVFPNVQQTWGLSVIEAASAGLLTIVSNGSGAHEVFKHGFDSLIYEGGNVGMLKNQIEEMLNNNDLYNSIAHNGCKMVKGKFSWINYAKAMENEFEISKKGMTCAE
jgi:glycosyltransferase involved in cell wall biosynthesis